MVRSLGLGLRCINNNYYAYYLTSTSLVRCASSCSWGQVVEANNDKREMRKRKTKLRRHLPSPTPPPAEKEKEGGVGIGFGGGQQQLRWKCASGCGACCKLEKGPAFPSPEEIFSDHPDLLHLYKSMIGPDGWCIHYHHPSRTCSIYPERPSFCRAEPDVFDELFGIPKRKFHKEACSACIDTITAVYGSASAELNNFNRLVRQGGT